MKLSPDARTNVNSSALNVSQNCTTTSFNLYSGNSSEYVFLYLDEGACRDTGLARADINVTFKDCPPPFVLSGDHCECEERLKKYQVECTIADGAYIVRKSGAKFWMKYSDEVLILHKNCPAEYCKTVEIRMTLSQSDLQCDLNRSGLLCGACATNYSLMLGSSRCQECSNIYLLLLLSFAAAGIFLVIFLSVLRLTVATGMVNSVIRYANIVQANRSLLLPSSAHTNILTIFIAWMNLDLGFQTCFYDGMTAYAQTWLQFTFPLYVWLMISLIIITSRYSLTFTKLLGSNPVAVLATLLLMSYTKVLKTIIEVYAFARLDYPGDRVVAVWLKDANVPYLKSWHLFLTVATTLFVVFLFLPYTFLLLFGYKLYRFSGRRSFRWLNRIKPLLDSYYAPYKKHTRYWTGLLLFYRCGLYSFFALGDTDTKLFTISVAFASLFVIAWLSGRVYSSFYSNAIEAFVYLNLIVLAVATYDEDIISPVLANVLVRMVFVIMMGVIVYHFHIHYTAKLAAWMKFVAKFRSFVVSLKQHVSNTAAESSPLLSSACSSPSHNPPESTTSVITLREPYLSTPNRHNTYTLSYS